MFWLGKLKRVHFQVMWIQSKFVQNMVPRGKALASMGVFTKKYKEKILKIFFLKPFGRKSFTLCGSILGYVDSSSLNHDPQEIGATVGSDRASDRREHNFKKSLKNLRLKNYLGKKSVICVEAFQVI